MDERRRTPSARALSCQQRVVRLIARKWQFTTIRGLFVPIHREVERRFSAAAQHREPQGIESPER